jgi:hypothetical protein
LQNKSALIFVGMIYEGSLYKMDTQLHEVVKYSLQLNEIVAVNDWVEKNIRIIFSGKIFCSSCGKPTNKSFQGFCYKCFTSAPEAAECILRPELCQAHLGKGRNVEWEEKHHNQPHFVYLALSDVVKVGVTRTTQVPTRWIDQGAHQAIRLAETPNRYEAGILEVALKSLYTDKTNWRKMLQHCVDESIDLVTEKWELIEHLPSDLTRFVSENDEITCLHYPVIAYPEKVNSINLDKTPLVEGKLMGIKGQYLLFEGGKVLNIRSHTGYYVGFEVV